jgi:hypothetical protein
MMGTGAAVAVTCSALAASVSTASGQSPADPAGGREASTMALTLSVEGGPPGLEAFLVERVRETWDSSVDIPRRNRPGLPMPVVSADSATVPYFYVEIDWGPRNRVTVTVEQGGELLTRRTVEIEDPVEARLTLWLLLKSTINRGLKQTARSEAPAEVEGAGPAPAEPSEGGDAGAEGDALAERLAGGIAAEPSEAHPIVMRVAPWFTLWLETPRLLAVGAAAVATWYWRFLAVAVQLGYRYAPGPDGLEVHALPLTGTVAFEIGERIRAGLGGLISGELKIPVSGPRAAVRAGADGGVFAQARMDVSEEWEVALRFGIAWRMIRLEYLYHDSAGQRRKTREAPWTTLLALGVAWR